MLFASVEARDTVIKTYGAIEGGNQTLARLADFLPQLNQLVLTRIFDAPRALVWKAWTDPKHLAQWFGPHGYTNPLCEVDVRPGGVMRIDMRAPDGTVYLIRGEFKEVVAPERLVFQETITSPAHSDCHYEVLNTITLAEEYGKTRLTLDVRPFVAGMDVGWAESLDRLESFVTKP
jgi:uncharacterized protein YndB with AHSA1/START domain